MSLGSLLQRFHGLRPLVVGDLMLDEYVLGQATRISPEAPVMVVRQRETRAVPGGAANVAANMVALGAFPSLVGMVGADAAGETLVSSLRQFGIDGDGVVRDAHRPTTRKTRILANHSQQVLRIDHEDDAPASSEVSKALLDAALARLPHVDVVLVSDYRKGAVTEETIRTLVAHGRKHGVPVVANPKPTSLPFYRGASLVSLNRYEAGDARGGGPLSDEDAVDVAAVLRQEFDLEGLVVTLGGSGMVAVTGQDRWHVPAVKVEVYDEAGAGDTVIATLALGSAAGGVSPDLLSLSAATAAAVVRKVGVAVPTPEDLAAIAAS